MKLFPSLFYITVSASTIFISKAMNGVNMFQPKSERTANLVHLGCLISQWLRQGQPWPLSNATDRCNRLSHCRSQRLRGCCCELASLEGETLADLKAGSTMVNYFRDSGANMWKQHACKRVNCREQLFKKK